VNFDARVALQEAFIEPLEAAAIVRVRAIDADDHAS
jgi:hypothetical protein